MKSNKAEIQAALSDLDQFIGKLGKASAELITAKSDAERLEKQIERSSDADYRDGRAVAALANAQKKLELCQTAVARLEEKASAASESYRAILYSAGQVVARVLQVIANRRIETVTSALLPFSGSKVRAEALAKSTDICQSATVAIQRYANLANGLIYNPDPVRILEAAQALREVLQEATKDAPDLMRFLKFSPAQEAPASVS